MTGYVIDLKVGQRCGEAHWLARPYLYGSLIRDSTPVYPGALQLCRSPKINDEKRDVI